MTASYKIVYKLLMLISRPFTSMVVYIWSAVEVHVYMYVHVYIYMHWSYVGLYIYICDLCVQLSPGVG